MKPRVAKKPTWKRTLEHDAAELLKARESVKQKFRSLKSDITQAKMQLEEGYKPITEPLRKLLTNIKTEIDVKKEPPEEPFSGHDVSSTSSTPKKEKAQKSRTIHQYLPTTMPSFLEMSEIGDTTTQVATNSDESLDSSAEINREVEKSRQYIRTFSMDTYNDWIDSFHTLPRTYIDDSVRDTEDLFDHQHGVKQLTGDGVDKFKIGNSEIKFRGKDVEVAGMPVPYPGTVGLYELLFKKFPGAYTTTDLDNYMDILKRTHAYRKGYKAEGQIHGTTSRKYTSIIRPYLQKKGILKGETYTTNKPFTRPPPPSLARPRSASLTALRALRQKPTQQGTGLTMSLSRNPIDYVYFDDPNELVNRLKLLIASQTAGHTGHNNEIVSIIEELREVGIIV